MKRFDKIKKIKSANIRLNESWLEDKKLLSEGSLISEAQFNDLFEFLAQGFGKMTQGSACYVADVDKYMNKNIIDPSTGEKMPNPMYGKLYKHTYFKFGWLDTYERAKIRKGITSEPGKRSGEYEKLEGFDMLETGKSGLYLPILPTGSKSIYAVLENGKFVEYDKSEAYKYLRPSKPKEPAMPDEPVKPEYRQLIVDRLFKLTGGGNEWTNPDFKFNYIGPTSL